MKKTLLLFVAVAASFSAYAHREAHGVYSRLGLETVKQSNTGAYYTINDATGFWNEVTAKAGEITTLTVDGVEYPAFKVTTGTKVNFRHKRNANYIESKELAEKVPLDMVLGVKCFVKSDNGSTITPSFTFRKTSVKDAAGTSKTHTVTFNIPGSVPVDGVTPFMSVTGTYSKWSNMNFGTAAYVEGDVTFFHNAVYTDCNMIFDGVQAGDIIAIVDVVWGTPDAFENNNWLDRNWHVPSLNDEVSVDGLPAGQIFIQAEDFDEKWINGRVAHSNTQPDRGYSDGYGYNPGRHRVYDNSCENIRIDLNYESGESSGFYLWKPGHGHTKDGLGFGLTNFAAQQWDAVYAGETVSEGTATFDHLADFFGAWTEYTINVEKDLYADISLCHGVSKANYEAYKNIGYQHGTITIENEPGVDYLKKYGAGYMVYVDGQPVRSNWFLRPGNSVDRIHDISTWIDNTEAVATYGTRSASANSYVTYAFPDVTVSDGNTWPAKYNTERIENMYNAGLIDEGLKNGMSVPDYANIPLSAGTHTIKVRSLGGKTVFDEIKVQAHPNADTPTGIDGVMSDFFAEDDADAPVEYFNLQGMRVENPQGGIFIRRQGTRATKVVVK